MTWYDVSTRVDVKDVEANKRIVIEWSNYCTVEWVFSPYLARGAELLRRAR